MRGRIASFAIGASIAKRRTASAITEQAQQAQQAQQLQKEIEQLKASQVQSAQQAGSHNQEDVSQKLLKYADLHQKGVLTDEEFQKLKMDLIEKL